jgi:glutamyl-tRNA reductase
MIARDSAGAAGSQNGSALVPYVRIGEEAARHLFEVAAGLESFVVGEREIASQLQRSLERSRTEHTGSPVLNGVGKVVGRLTRDTHKLNLTGAGPRGVHDLAVDFLLHARSNLSRVVVVGLGQIGERVVRALRGAGLKPTLCNRSPSVSWAADTPIQPLHRLPEVLAEAEGAVVCTAAPQPIVTLNQLGPRIGGPPLLIVDLGIPAQVDQQIPEEIADVADLETVQQASGHRQMASWADLAHVRGRVNQAVSEFTAFCREREMTLLLRRTQERHQRYIRVEIPKVVTATLPDLPAGERTRLESELRGLVRRYTNAVFEDVRDLLRDPEEE